MFEKLLIFCLKIPLLKNRQYCFFYVFIIAIKCWAFDCIKRSVNFCIGNLEGNYEKCNMQCINDFNSRIQMDQSSKIATKLQGSSLFFRNKLSSEAQGILSLFVEDFNLSKNINFFS